MSREGKHKAGQARLQFYIEPRYKAMLALLGQELGEANMTDTLLAIIRMVAHAKGITTPDGRPQPAFVNRFNAEMAMIIKTK